MHLGICNWHAIFLSFYGNLLLVVACHLYANIHYMPNYVPNSKIVFHGQQTVKISLFKLSKFSFPNCQNFLFQNLKISLSKLSKFPFSNCQNFPFQTVKIFLSKLSKFPFPKLSKFPFPNCQNFPFSNCQNFLFQTVKNSTSVPNQNHEISPLCNAKINDRHNYDGNHDFPIYFAFPDSNFQTISIHSCLAIERKMSYIISYGKLKFFKSKNFVTCLALLGLILTVRKIQVTELNYVSCDSNQWLLLLLFNFPFFSKKNRLPF